MIRLAAFLICMWAGLCVAQDNPAAQARDALAALDAASTQLDEASRARDRVTALTATIQAFEEGLGAMREGLRQAAIRERILTERLKQQDKAIAVLLGTLQAMGRTDSPTVLLHPDGAIGTARAGMLLAELGPALDGQARALRRDLEDLQTLQSLQQAAATRMSDGLAQVQAARAELNQAMAERQPLPKRFSEDPTRAAILVASARTLDAFAQGLRNIVFNEVAPPLSLTASRPIGQWRPPVQGVVLRGAGEADAAGVVRPGVLLATRPRALVASPSAATIRFAGDLLDLGQVIILEPQAETLLVLSGLGIVYGEAGDVIPEGTPVGMMGGTATQGNELLSPNGEGAGTDRSETLYIEIRENNRTVDPALWFAFRPRS